MEGMPRAKTSRGTIYTAGYEGKSLSEFMAYMVAQGIAQLLDVRKNAVSRKKGFSKSALRSAAVSHGLSYIHISELGVPSEMRRDLKSREDYANLMVTYKKQLLPKARESVKAASDAVKTRPTAVLCFESDYTICHRTPLSSALSKITGYNVTHL